MSGRVVIVGAGLAGYNTARALSAGGYEGEIIVLGAETHRPYDRPPLSKAFLSGDITRADLALEADGDCPGVMWMLGSTAVGLDAGRREVVLDSGARLAADDIVIATGSRPRRLPGSAEGVYPLATIEDAEALRGALVPGASVVVAGAGFVGLEAAAAAVRAGADVTVISADDAPLLRRRGPLAADVVRGIHERRGVRFVTGARVDRVAESEGRVDGVVLDDGTRLAASVVIAGIGADPAVDWLDGSGLDIDGGVACDLDGRAAPGIWAVGDCAVWEGIPCGHWTEAAQRAGHVAGLLTGTGPAMPEAPYVWSDQFDAKLQFAGELSGGEVPVVEAGSLDGDDLFVTYHRDGVSVAAFAVNQPRLMMRWRKTHRPAVRAAAHAAA